MKYRLFLSALGASLLIGCASSPTEQAELSARIQQASRPVQVPVPVPFDEVQARKAMEPGNITIKGVLYHRVTLRGEHIGTDAWITTKPAHNLSGIRMQLYPASEHVNEFFRLVNENRRQRASSRTAQLKHFITDPRLPKYGKSTRTDEHGRYVFTGLKPGKYRLVAENVDLTVPGTESVVTGSSVVGGVVVRHYGSQSFTLERPLEYTEEVEVSPGQQELKVESRMRYYPEFYPRR